MDECFNWLKMDAFVGMFFVGIFKLKSVSTQFSYVAKA